MILPDKSIFVAIYIGILNTVIGSDSYVDKSDLTASTKFKEIFAQYSNLVVFSGLSHFNLLSMTIRFIKKILLLSMLVVIHIQ